MANNDPIIIRIVPPGEKTIKIAMPKERKEFLALRYETPDGRGIPQLEYRVDCPELNFSQTGFLDKHGQLFLDNIQEGEYQVFFLDPNDRDWMIVAAEFRDAVASQEGLTIAVQLLNTDPDDLQEIVTRYEEHFNDFTGDGLIEDLWQLTTTEEESSMLDILINRSGLSEMVTHNPDDPDEKPATVFDPDRYMIHSTAFDDIIFPNSVISYSFGLKPGRKDESGVDLTQCHFQWCRFQADYPNVRPTIYMPLKGEHTWYNQEWKYYNGNACVTVKVIFNNGEEHSYQLLQYIRDESDVIQSYQLKRMGTRQEGESLCPPVPHPVEIRDKLANTLSQLNEMEAKNESGEKSCKIDDDYKKEKERLEKLHDHINGLVEAYAIELEWENAQSEEENNIAAENRTSKRVFLIKNTVYGEKIAQPMSLRLFLHRGEEMIYDPYEEKVRPRMTLTMVDWTNPESLLVTNGYSVGRGWSYREALENLMKNWERENSYYQGTLYFEIPKEVFTPLLSTNREIPNTALLAMRNTEAETIQLEKDTWHVIPDPICETVYHGKLITDGSNFWTEAAEWLDMLSKAAMVISIAVLCVAPIPGSRVAAALMATSMIAGAGAGAMHIARRRMAGEEWGIADAIDIVGIALDMAPIAGKAVGPFFKGVKNGKSIMSVPLKAGSKLLGKNGMFILDMTGEAIEGVLITVETAQQLEDISNDENLTPLEKMKRRREVIGSAVLQGAMKAISMKHSIDGWNARKRDDMIKKLESGQEIDPDNLPDTNVEYSKTKKKGLNSWQVVTSSINRFGLRRTAKKIAKRAIKKLRHMTTRKFWICEVLKAEPVHSVTGAVYLDQEDFDLPGRLPLTWSRSYNSQESWKGVHGVGWLSPADARLIVDGQTREAAFYGGEKQTHIFPTIPNPLFDYGTVESGGDGALLDFVDGQYEVTTKGGLIYRFEAESRVVPESALIKPWEEGLEAENEEEENPERYYRVVSIRDLRDNRWGFEWDGDDLVGLTSDGDHDIRIESEAGLIRSFRWNDRTLVRYDYENDNLTCATDSLNVPYEFEYDEHRLTKHTNGNGVFFCYEYGEEDKHRCYKTWGEDPNDPDQKLYDTQFEYSAPVGQAGSTTVIAADGTKSVIRYDANFRPFEETVPYAKEPGKVTTTEYRYDDWGRTDTVTVQDMAILNDPGRSETEMENAVRTTRYTYDDYGNVLEVIRPDGKSAKTYYNEFHQPTKVVDAKGNEWINQYEDDRLVAETSPEGVTRQIVHSTDQSQMIVLEGLTRTTYELDSWGLVTKVETSGNQLIRQSIRDDFGQETKRIEPDGTTLFKYDNNFRLVKAERFALRDINCRNVLRTTTFHWDKNDNLLERYEDGRSTLRCSYTGLDKIATRQEADSAVQAINYWYDGEERLIAVQNEKGESYKFERDPMGRVIKETDYWNQSQQYRYNGLGDLIEHKSGSGSTAMFYDELGRLKSRIFPGGGTDERFEWDDNGNLSAHGNNKATVQRRYDKDNRLIGELQRDRDGSTFIVRYGYDTYGYLYRRESFFDVTDYSEDHEGNFRARKYGHHNEVYHYYDGSGFCRSIKINGKEFKFDRDKLGRLKQEEFPGFFRNSEYDDFGRLKEQKLVDKREWLELLSDAKTLGHRSYNYDRRGNLSQKSDHIRSRTFRYEYTPNGNLTSATDPDHRIHSYIPDSAGNLLQRTGTSGSFESSYSVLRDSWDRGSQSRYTDSWSYRFDKQGRCTTRTGESAQHNFEWDSEGQLTNSKPTGSNPTEYSYDASGRRIKKETNGEETRFYWDGDALLGDKANGKIREFVYYPGTFEPLAMIEDDELYIYNNDINGAPVELLKQNGEIVWSAEYSALGEVTKTFENSVDNPLRLQGQYFDDETGLHYNRHRYYDPKAGSFISQDPIGLSGGMNPYTYGPNTWEWTDPLGLTKTKCQLQEDSLKGSIDDAIRARDEALDELDKLSNRKRNDITTVVGAVNLKTGEVAVGSKSSKKYGPTLCAEDLAVEALGGNAPHIMITPAIRPRGRKVIPVCLRCQTKYSRDQFPSGTEFE